MPRINLRVYIDPGEVQIFCNLQRKDGQHETLTDETLTAAIDTGAAISLFPKELLNIIAHRVSDKPDIVVDQAGIAGQSFQAVEAFVTISLEDEAGNITSPFEIRAWFTETNTRLIGFADILDRAILHVDMIQRAGWLEIDV